MKSGFTLSVPNPCSEDWNSFTPTETGGFCGRCQKNVVDFTHATDDEIIAFISKKPEHACGRFKSNQLKTYTIFPAEKVTPGFMLLKAGVASLLLLLVSKHVSAQVSVDKPSTETHQVTEVSKESKDFGKSVVRGRVVSSEDNLGMPAVSVVQKGTTNGTSTDIDGTFELIVDSESPQILTFSFIGYVTEEVQFKHPITANINVILSPDITGFLGEVIWTGETQTDLLYSEKQSFLKRSWKKITGWF